MGEGKHLKGRDREREKDRERERERVKVNYAAKDIQTNTETYLLIRHTELFLSMPPRTLQRQEQNHTHQSDLLTGS